MPEALWLPLAYAGLCALVFVPLEDLAPLRRRARAQWGTDLLFATAGAVLAHGLLSVVAGGLLALAAVLPPGPLAGAPLWASVSVALGLFELAGYAAHRAAHRVPALWALHEVHHSAEELDWLAGFRQHPLEIVWVTLVQNLPLVLLGIPFGVHGLVAVAVRLNTQFVHSNLATPAWLRPWLATPSFHHRHHQRDGRAANFAAMFPWLDRLFGTYAPENPGAAGLPDRRRKGFLGWLLHPFAATSYLAAGGDPCPPSPPSAS